MHISKSAWLKTSIFDYSVILVWKKKKQLEIIGSVEFHLYKQKCRDFKEAMMEFIKTQNEWLEEQRRLDQWKSKRTDGKNARTINVEKDQGNAKSFLPDSLIISLGKFKYNPVEEVTLQHIFTVIKRIFKKLVLHGGSKRQ